MEVYFKRRFTFARIDISYARFFFYESAEKVLSYARLNCAVLNYFYMSLGQVRHTIVVSRYQNCLSKMKATTLDNGSWKYFL